jgi:acyl-CoA reductase-like NAD-dependent aldehyde dehydrogenase
MREKFDGKILDRLLKGVTLASVRDPIPVSIPYTGEVLGVVPAGQEDDVRYAVELARQAQSGWAAQTYSARAAILLRFHDLLLKRQDQILGLIQLENGKARLHAFEEVMDTAIVARYYAFRGERFLRPRRRNGALILLTQTWEQHVPVGVVGFIVPWNYPLNLSMTDAIPALLAGNTVVLKPDPQTSFTALWGADLLREAGLPPGVMNVVTGEGPVAGAALPKYVDYVMFTGSGRTGRLVAGQAADRLIGCSLELGGKNPMIVLEDADLEAAVDGAVRGCFVGAGQVCISIERIYVQRSLYQRFVDRFGERTRALKLGAALDYSVEIGSLTSERQLRTVESHVQDAVAKGATVVAGGKRRPDLGPLFYEPTILTGVTEPMIPYAAETFGPVVSVYPFDSENEAIRLANNTPYGLSSSVWTRNTSRGRRVASQLRAGSVNVNEAYVAAWGSVDSPIGGQKESGLRCRHGEEGILKFTETQTVAIQRLLPIAPLPSMTRDAYARMMTFLLRMMRRLPFLS